MIESIVVVLLALLVLGVCAAGVITVTKVFIWLFTKAGILVISVVSLTLLFSMAYLRTLL
jgi:hypothetical protein